MLLRGSLTVSMMMTVVTFYMIVGVLSWRYERQYNGRNLVQVEFVRKS